MASHEPNDLVRMINAVVGYSVVRLQIDYAELMQNPRVTEF
jgi:hypothetical protein